MLRIKPATRIAITLGFISATLVWIAHGLSLIPSPESHLRQKRLVIVKTLAGSISGLASAKSTGSDALKRSLQMATRLNDDVASVGVRGKFDYLARSEDHAANWQPEHSESNPNQAQIEVFSGKRLWGTLEVCFVEADSNGFVGFMFPLTLVAFVSLFTTGFSWWVLNRSFRYLNPSKVVPKRVRSAFDTLTEGLVLIDGNYEIAHANKAFIEIIDSEATANSLLGTKLDSLGWRIQDDTEVSSELPWLRCISKEASVTGKILEIGDGDARRKFFVNSAPIFGNKSDCRGAMISFDDVTEMEQKKIELAELVKTLRNSRDEVEIQNQKLTFLASYDPLTECMNRRAFWDLFEKMWEDTEPFELSLLMIDVDHFKSCNDTYGHSFGDLVLKELGETLRNTVGDGGVVCRFGGEEFIVALANMELDEALELTHEIHKAIREMDIEGKNVSASIGFSNRQFKAMDGQHMLDQADISLYQAKRNGRDRVVRFDECEANEDIATVAEPTESLTADVIKFPQDAADGFLRAIELRCQTTADHSRRVARLCAGVGKTLLKPDDVQQLEAAAQIHEIGIIGVPDATLSHSRHLSTADLHAVEQQKKVGLQLLQTVFNQSIVPQVIEEHQNFESPYHDSNTNLNNELDSGNDSVEMFVAILAACNEFDALLHGSDTRLGLQVDEAIARMKESTPARFHVDVVEKLEEHIGKYGAERQLARRGGLGENWPPKLHASIDVTSKSEIQAAGAEIAANYGDKSNAAEESHRTSLDQEISNTLKLANELLGLCDENRSVVENAHDEKSAER